MEKDLDRKKISIRYLKNNMMIDLKQDIKYQISIIQTSSARKWHYKSSMLKKWIKEIWVIFNRINSLISKEMRELKISLRIQYNNIDQTQWWCHHPISIMNWMLNTKCKYQMRIEIVVIEEHWDIKIKNVR